MDSQQISRSVASDPLTVPTWSVVSTYLLDTSAVRAVGRTQLEQAAESHDLLLSPWSLWELASHLDEAVGQSDASESFMRQRGQVLKCRLLTLLDEPFAEHADEVGARSVVNPTRFDDRHVANEFLTALGGAQRADDFFSSTIEYPDGTPARLTDVAANIRRELQVEETRYVAHIRQIGRLLEEHVGVDRLRGETADDDLVESVLAPCRNLAAGCAGEGIDDPMLFGNVVASAFLHLAYKHQRAKMSLVAAGTADAMSVDANDFEDGAITFHVNLFGNRTLVTGDEGTRGALVSSIDALKRSVKSKGLSLPIAARVIGTAEFTAEVG